MALRAALLGRGADGGRAPRRCGGRAPAGCEDGSIEVEVDAGEVLDEVVLRSYCIGAAHMALSWVTSEELAVGPDGRPDDLTVRSFGVLRAVDTPAVDVVIAASDAPAGERFRRRVRRGGGGRVGVGRLPAPLAHGVAWTMKRCGACRPGAAAAGMMAAVPGVVIIVVVLVVVFPVVVIMSGAVAAGVLGWFLKQDTDATGDEIWKELNY